MTVHVFFNQDLVQQLALCGITARRQPSSIAPAPGFVLEGRRVPPRARETVTNVVAVQGHVTITAPRQASSGRSTQPARPAAAPVEPQTALELVEECARHRRDNQRLADEVARLRGEIARLTGAAAPREPQDHGDDSAARFALLELD